MGWLTNLETYWELPGYRRFMQRLAGFTRLILFDKRGMGLSDRSVMGTLEERMDDVRAVMDAVGSERAVLLGVSEGAPLSMVFAATHPERTAGLIFVGGEVKEIREDDWPWGNQRGRSTKACSRDPERRDRVGKGQARLVRAEQRSTTRRWSPGCPAPAVIGVPRGSSRLHAARKRDRRPPRAPSIHVPTLVIHAPEDPVVPYRAGPLAGGADRGSPLRRARGQGSRALVRCRRPGCHRDRATS